jgi:hypothetical protein
MFFAVEHGFQAWGVNIAVRLPSSSTFWGYILIYCVKTVTLSITAVIWALIVYRRKKHISVSYIPGPCPESFFLGECFALCPSH